MVHSRYLTVFARIFSGQASGFRGYYRRYVEGYRAYLRRRGFGCHENDWFFVKRGFLACWMAPGFYRFWHTWNPGIGYLTFQLYRRFGGNKRGDFATILTFVINGLIHNMVGCLMAGRWSFSAIFTFLSLGILTVLSRRIEPVLMWERWPGPANLILNVAFVLLSFDLGFTIDHCLCTLGWGFGI